jgi:cytochrome c oxidase cbb3-type subunit 3/ubiquinol-cytochrome c reductase cytochrome c subunit
MLKYISAVLGMILISGCMSAPGRPGPDPEVLRPEQVTDFATLYGTNCAGCHGSQRAPGASIPLANPLYLSVAGRDNLLRITAKGIPGTLMPGFANSSGGMLTNQQVESIVDGALKNWGSPASAPNAPPYAAILKGDPLRGGQLFATFCGKCHRNDGKGSTPSPAVPAAVPGSIVDPAYLSLISDQGLRSYVIAGRPGNNPNESMPDYRGDVEGHSMTDQEITDVVAWLSSQRPSTPK